MQQGRRLPAGNNRVRAGDRDREIATELLERHHNAGRLTTEELDERVADALQARTLGQLRRLLDDLPGDHTEDRRPPRSATPGTTSLAVPRRRRRLRPRWVVAAGVLLLGVGIVTAGDQDAGERGRFLPPPAERITTVAPGQAAEDGSFTFRLRRVAVVEVLQPRYDDGKTRPRRARPGFELLAATVRARNDGETTDTPFCSTGAELYTTDDIGYEAIDDLYVYETSDVICGQGMTPGEAQDVPLVFEVPEGAEVRDLDVWDASEESDISGATRLRMAPPEA